MAETSEQTEKQSKAFDLRECDWVSPTGDTIKDILEEQHKNVVWLCTHINLDMKQTEKLLNGEFALPDDVAIQLSKVLGSSVEFWIMRDARYRARRIQAGGSILQTRDIPDFLDAWRYGISI